MLGTIPRLRVNLDSSSDLLDLEQVLSCLSFNFLHHFGYSTGVLLGLDRMINMEGL